MDPLVLSISKAISFTNCDLDGEKSTGKVVSTPREMLVFTHFFFSQPIQALSFLKLRVNIPFKCLYINKG